MVAHQVKERLLADERGRPIQGLPIAARRRLLDEGQQPGVLAGRLPVGGLAAAADNDADFFNPGGDDLLEDDLQGRLLRPVEVDEALQRQTILVGAGGRNDGLADVHDRVPRLFEIKPRKTESSLGVKTAQAARERPRPPAAFCGPIWRSAVSSDPFLWPQSSSPLALMVSSPGWKHKLIEGAARPCGESNPPSIETPDKWGK